MAKKETDEVKIASEMRKDKTSLRTEMRDIFSFIKFVIGFLFGLSIVGLGGIAIYIGKFATNLPIDIPALGQLALVVSGACAVVDGFVVLWKVRKVK